MSSKVFGIDLGTTYSCIAHVDQYGVPTVVLNSEGQPTTPSVVMFNQGGTVSVGGVAKAQAGMFEDRVAQLVKPHMGDAEWQFTVDGEAYTAPAVASKVLEAVVEDARLQTGEDIQDVVITVPAYFGQAEREATRAAGEIAHLNVVDIINEPTAAAFAYGFGVGEGQDQTVLVYDLGGGTFDITVIRVEPGRIRVIATEGDHELGGNLWDEQVAALLSEKFQAENPDADDPLLDPNEAGDLRLKAEEAKRHLSTLPATRVKVQSGAHLGMIEITREDFDNATSSLLERTIDLTRRVLEQARELDAGEIDRILLVGGSSLMPQVSERLTAEFGYELQLADPHMAVAKGAALWGQKQGITVEIAEELRKRGVEVNGSGSLADVDEAVLDEVLSEVAPRAGLTKDAMQKIVETEATNVCSQGFGVVVVDGDTREEFVDFLIHRNTPLPASHTETYETLHDDAISLIVDVREQATQDESKLVDNNTTVVAGEIEGLPRGYPAGTPVDVTFAMDNAGRLTVTARHPGNREPLVLEHNAASAVGAEQVEAMREQMSKLSRAR
jgi:molecular chaperone DnaK (HSP70)